jgi:hypothetical protein
LVIGIVVADTKGLLFSEAMSELTTEGTRPVDPAAESAGGLSQVHALNCIKDIFKNSRLGERSEAYVPQALSLAAKCLSSDTYVSMWMCNQNTLLTLVLDGLSGTPD